MNGNVQTTSGSGVPLRGVRLVSLADDVLPTLTKAFADLGADIEVIRLGSRPTVDPLKDLLHSRGKRIVEMAIESADARTQIEQRLGEAHAVVVTAESVAAAGYADISELAQHHPNLVVALLTDFGLSGEKNSWVGSEAVYHALSGTLSRSGEPGGSPLVPPGDLFLSSAAQEIAWAILSAVFRSLTSSVGRGAVLDCSIFEAGAASLDPAYGMAGSGTPDMLSAYDRPDVSNIYPIFRVLDGHVRLCVLAKGQWLAMRSWMGDPQELMGDDLLTNPGRYLKSDLIGAAIGAFVASMTCQEVVDQCRERRIPAARVLSLDEVLREEHYLVNGVFTEVGELEGRPVVAAEGMVRIDGRRSVPPEIAPTAAQERVAAVPANGLGQPYPLSGLTVLDVGVIVAGATVGQLFAQLGARVIRVENINFPDGMRRSFEWSTPSQARGHRGKESVGLDLRSDEGRRIFHELARDADVVSSNFKPGTVERLGISYADLSAINPRLVCLESSAFGDTGPWRTAMGYGPLVRAASGLTALWREGPAAEYFADGLTLYPDHFVGRVGAIAALACVWEARRTGRGAHITVSQADVALVQLAEQLATTSLAPSSVQAPGNLPSLLNRVVFPTAGDDQWCVVDPRTPTQLDALRRVVGASAGGEGAAVAAYLGDRDADEVAAELQAAGVPAARMLRVAELPDQTGLQSRDWFTTTEVAGTEETVLVERYPILSPDMQVPELAPMPMFGAQTRAVLSELGRSEDEIAKLFDSGVAQEAGGARQ